MSKFLLGGSFSLFSNRSPRNRKSLGRLWAEVSTSRSNIDFQEFMIRFASSACREQCEAKCFALCCFFLVSRME